MNLPHRENAVQKRLPVTAVTLWQPPPCNLLANKSPATTVGHTETTLPATERLFVTMP